MVDFDVPYLKTMLVFTTIVALMFVVSYHRNPDHSIGAVSDVNSISVSVESPKWMELEEDHDFWYSLSQKQLMKRKPSTFMMNNEDGHISEYTEMVKVGKKPTGMFKDFRYIGKGNLYALRFKY